MKEAIKIGFGAVSGLVLLAAWAYTFWEAAKMAVKIFPSQFFSVPFWSMSIASIFNFLMLSLLSAFILILGILFVPLCFSGIEAVWKAVCKAGLEVTQKEWEESEMESVEKAAERPAKNSAEYDLLNKVFGKKTGKK